MSNSTNAGVPATAKRKRGSPTVIDLTEVEDSCLEAIIAKKQAQADPESTEVPSSSTAASTYHVRNDMGFQLTFSPLLPQSSNVMAVRLSSILDTQGAGINLHAFFDILNLLVCARRGDHPYLCE